MKKIFTLLFATFMIGSAFAQSAFVTPQPVLNHAITISAGFHRYDDMYSFTPYERDWRIKKINEEYNFALKNIINMRFISAGEKLRLIRIIENTRMEKIRSVRARFNDYRNKYNDYYYDGNFRWRR